MKVQRLFIVCDHWGACGITHIVKCSLYLQRKPAGFIAIAYAALPYSPFVVAQQRIELLRRIFSGTGNFPALFVDFSYPLSFPFTILARLVKIRLIEYFKDLIFSIKLLSDTIARVSC